MRNLKNGLLVRTRSWRVYSSENVHERVPNEYRTSNSGLAERGSALVFLSFTRVRTSNSSKKGNWLEKGIPAGKFPRQPNPESYSFTRSYSRSPVFTRSYDERVTKPYSFVLSSPFVY